MGIPGAARAGRGRAEVGRFDFLERGPIMPFEVKLPDIGEGVAEGEIVRWLVKAGDAVKEHQPLVEVMTDKATVEIPSPRTGTIAAIHAEEGQVVPVGTVIVAIDVAGEPAGAAPATGHAAARAGEIGRA